MTRRWQNGAPEIAEKLSEAMTGKDLARRRRVIAGLKSAIAKGPARLGGAALKTRRRVQKMT